MTDRTEALDIDRKPETPPRLAIDADGYGWRVYDDHWSMIPVNPDNSPIPQPVAYYVPETKDHRTEALDIEADIERARDGIDTFAGDGSTEMAAFERIIQALKASNEERDGWRMAEAKALAELQVVGIERNVLLEERERVRALPEEIRREPVVGDAADEEWLLGYQSGMESAARMVEAALSHPISPERSDEDA